MPGDLKIRAIISAVDRTARVIGRIQGRFKRFNDKVRAGFGRIDRGATKVAKVVGKGLVWAFKAATVAATALGAAAWKVIDTGAGFEKSLVSAAARMGDGIKKGSKEFVELENVVRGLGATTEFSASQVAEASKFLAMAGMDQKQTIAMLPAVIDMATASEMELAEAADIATDVLGSMGLASEDAATQQKNLTRVMDVLVKTANSANTTVGMIYESIQEAGSISTQAGVDIETYGAAIMAMAAGGIKASKAGTGMKNAMLSLTAMTPQGAKALRKLGVVTEDSSGNMRDFVDIIRDIEKGMDGLGNVQQLKRLKEIFGKIGGPAFAQLLTVGSDAIEKYRIKTQEAAGSNAELAKTMRDTTAGSIANFKSAIESVIISLFKMEDKGITGVIDSITEWIRQNEKFIVSGIKEFLDDIRENLDEIVFVFKALGTTIGIIFGVTLAIKMFSAALWLVNAALMANPLVLIIGAIVIAVAIAAALIIYYWDDIVGAYNKMVEAFETGIDATVEFFIGAGEAIRSTMEAAINWVIEKIYGLLDMLGPVGDLIKETFGLGDEPIKVKLGTAAEKRAETIFTDKRADFGRPQMVTPQERAAASIEERRTTERSEVTIKDETKRAAVTRGRLGGGVKLQRTGSF